MNKQNKLLLQRNIFVFIIIITFGIIIVQEKKGDIFIPKAEKKFTDYLNEKYPQEIDNWTLGKVIYQNKAYKMKISSKDNKHYFFTLTYKNKKINDSYQTDYLEGKTLISYSEKKIKKEISKTTNNNPNIIIPTTLDNLSEPVKDKLLKEEELISISIYTLEDNLSIPNFTTEQMLSSIEKTITSYEKHNINPKKYTLTINNQHKITDSIIIENITKDFLTNPNKIYIINAIINDEPNDYLTQSKITYKYLN